MTPEFKSFPKIGRLENLRICITQKMHGTNAQIYITEDKQIFAASRNRWLSVEDDNHGFASFVEKYKEELISVLGPGRHFGEWCGPGINHAEGLKEKTLFLFNWRRWENVELPNRVRVIPVLHDEHADSLEPRVCIVMGNLKDNGSKAVPGFMKVEGIVVELYGDNIQPIFMKQTFEQEETAWCGVKKERKPFDPTKYADVSHLLQPMRLEKLLSRDSRYVRDYPSSLKQIFSDYVTDLQEENQLPADEDQLKEVKKALGKKLFPFVKEQINIIGCKYGQAQPQ